MKSINFKVITFIVILIGIICIIFINSQVTQVSAFSVKELLDLKKVEQGSPDEEELKTSTTNKWAKTAEESVIANPQLDLDHFTLMFVNMSKEEKSQVLSDNKVFKQVVENEANNRSVISAAITNKLEQDRNIEFLMRRGAENILREIYLKKLIGNKISSDFPTEKQIADYYGNNKQRFLLPERVHVWQIYFNKPKDVDKNQLVEIKKKAKDIYSSLKKGQADFSSIAMAESEHDQSKVLGGYMGLIKTNELLPDIKEPLLKLKENQISKPIESETGIHILKRGEILAPENLGLNQVQNQVRQLLINQVNTQLRDAIFVQARKEFPQDISDEKMEAWRLQLQKTNTN